MKTHIRILAFLLCILLLFTHSSCMLDATINGGNSGGNSGGNTVQLPSKDDFWQNQKDDTASDSDSWGDVDLTPEIDVTIIGGGGLGGNNREETITDKLGNDSEVYDIVFQNVAFALETVGFSTDIAIAVNTDGEEGESSLGLMYYYDDLNLFNTNEFYAAGFYEILSENESSRNFEDAETLVIQSMGKGQESESIFLASFDYQDVSYDHFVFDNKYVIYYQESNNTIRYIEKENVKANYDLSLGSLYDYDKKQYIYDESIFGEYKNHSGVEGIFGDTDFAELEANLKELSDNQLKNGYIVSEFNIVYISPESIQTYLASEEEETFFGYRISDLTTAFGAGTALLYNGTSFEQAQIVPNDDYDWKTFLIKCGIGCGIILVGAILTPLTGGASFGCALITIAKTTVCSALVEGLGTLAVETVIGLIQGKDFKEALKNASHEGLDAFANAFLIGSAVNSVGVVTGLIKPTACFAAGTRVSMGSGLSKVIEDIAVGDSVLSYNEHSKELSSHKVTNLFKKTVDTTLKLRIGGMILETTVNHPFYSPKYNGWVEAGTLAPGDSVLTADGSNQLVESVEFIAHPNGVEVYNFTVDVNHTYFVGENEILVHNDCNRISDQEIANWRNKAGQDAKNEALNDLIEGRNLKKWGLNVNDPKDMEILSFIQENHRYPSFQAGDGMQLEFAHGVDVNTIRKAFEDNKITKQQAKNFISNSKNGILTSHENHYLLHGGNWSNTTDVKTVVRLRPSIESTIKEILKAIA